MSSAAIQVQMDPQVSENCSYSTENVFAAELLTFVLSQYNISWRWPFYPTNRTRHFFRASIGQAISNFMIQNIATIRSSTLFILPENGSWNPDSLKRCLHVIISERPGREFPTLVCVNAMLCCIAVSLARRGDLRLVDDIVGIIAYTLRVLVGIGNWRWLELSAESLNKVVKIPDAA